MCSRLRKISGLVALLLAGCAGAPALSGGEVLPAEAQRVIDRATATAQAVATESALATAARVSVLEQAEAQRTATAEAFVAAQQAATLDALHLAQSAERTRTELDAQRAMANATGTQGAANVVATQQAQQAEFETQVSQVALVVWNVVLVVFGVAGLGLLVRLGWDGIDALVRWGRGRAAVVNTRYGPALVETVNGNVRLTLMAPPPRAALQRPPEPPRPVREFFIGQERVMREEQLDATKEQELRADLVALVQAAISASGGESNIIPRHDKLGMGGAKRGRLVGALNAAGLVMVDKSATILAGQRTLFVLLTDLQKGLSIRPVEVVNVAR